MGEFSCGCKYQDDGSVTPFEVGLVVNVDNARQKVAAGLARTGLRNPDHVLALEGNWPALSLDGCGCLVALLVDLIEDVVWEAGFLKGGDGRWTISLGVPLNADFLCLPELFHLVFGPVDQVGMGVVEVPLEGGQGVLVPVDFAQAAPGVPAAAATSSESTAVSEAAAASAATSVTATA